MPHAQCNRGFGSFESRARGRIAEESSGSPVKKGCQRPYHVKSVKDIARTLRRLAKKLENDADYLINISYY